MFSTVTVTRDDCFCCRSKTYESGILGLGFVLSMCTADMSAGIVAVSRPDHSINK